MATKVFDAVAAVGTYTDRQGNEKKRYVTVGAVFENDKKQMSLKIESIPVGGEWNGWVSFYEPKEQTRQEPKKQQSNTGSSWDDMPSDLPF